MIGLRALVIVCVVALCGCPSAAPKKHQVFEGKGSGGGQGADGGHADGDADGEEMYDDDDDAEGAGEEELAEDADVVDEPGWETTGGVKRKKKRKARRSSGGKMKQRPKPRVDVAERERTAAVERTGEQRAALTRPQLARARAALRAGDHDKAIGFARQVLAIDGGEVDAIEILAEAYYRKGWLPKAARVLASATAGIGAKVSRLWMLRGLVADAEGRPLTEVRDAYLRATSLAPRYARAWNNLGVVQLRLQKYAQAIAAFETALANDKDSVAVLTNVGTAYRRHAGESKRDQQRDDLLRKAERAYRAAIAIDEDYAPAYLNLGVLYLDASSFPRMSDTQRLTTALSYLREFKQRGVPARAEDGGIIVVDAYLAAAQKQLEAIEHGKRQEKRSGAPARE